MPEPPRLTPPPIWILAFGAAAGPMAVTLIAPAVPLIRESLRIDGNTAQLILTMLLVSMGVGQLLAGPSQIALVADRSFSLVLRYSVLLEPLRPSVIR